MARMLSGLLAIVLGANALTMLFAGLWWYGVVPGVTATGPYNPHLVRDVGAAYLVTAGALGAYAWKLRPAWPALVCAAAFLTLHAAVHVFDAVCGTHPMKDVLRDFAGVYLPALVSLGLAACGAPATKEMHHAQGVA